MSAETEVQTALTKMSDEEQTPTGWMNEWEGAQLSREGWRTLRERGRTACSSVCGWGSTSSVAAPRQKRKDGVQRQTGEVTAAESETGMRTCVNHKGRPGPPRLRS